jgi:hypothetical protein
MALIGKDDFVDVRNVFPHWVKIDESHVIDIKWLKSVIGKDMVDWRLYVDRLSFTAYLCFKNQDDAAIFAQSFL